MWGAREGLGRGAKMEQKGQSPTDLERWIGKDLEMERHGIFQGTLQALSCKYATSREITVSTGSNSTDIRTQYIQNTSLERYPYTKRLCFEYVLFKRLLSLAE
jgi:hypothetical protein